ncbi:MAG: dipicolinate synthase subunit B, partial [Clostridia bacterium]|nr:dipicolinate synthase subunit B [Clostridia bacterium]
MEKVRIGFAITGSFCTFKSVFVQLETLIAQGFRVTPIMSQNAYSTDTRFGRAQDWVKKAEEITGESVIHTIAQAEPIGPKKLLDILVIAPCTGNTLAKLSCGIADTSVTLAAKSHLRNDRPVVVAVSTNDALGRNGSSIGKIFSQKNFYFVPFGQDDFSGKPASCVAHFDRLNDTVYEAL